MALIECTQCGKSISDKATHCPHCGAEVSTQSHQPQEQDSTPRKHNKKRNIIISVILLLLLTGGITAYLMTRPPVADITLKIYVKRWLKDHKFAADFEEANLHTDSIGFVEFTNLDPEAFVKYAEAFNGVIKRNDLYYSWGARTSLGKYFTDAQKQRLEAANYYVDSEYLIYNDRNIKNVFLQYPDETEVHCSLYLCTNEEYQQHLRYTHGRHPYFLDSSKLHIETDEDSPSGFRLIDSLRPYEEVKNIDELKEYEELPEFDQSIGFDDVDEEGYVKSREEINSDEATPCENLTFGNSAYVVEDDNKYVYEYSEVDIKAQFAGGDAEMLKWISHNIRYPESASANEIQGRVLVKFVIEKNGAVTNLSIVRGVDNALDKEALRVVRNMPNFTPAKKNGLVVRSYYMIPITFKLR